MPGGMRDLPAADAGEQNSWDRGIETRPHPGLLPPADPGQEDRLHLAAQRAEAAPRLGSAANVIPPSKRRPDRLTARLLTCLLQTPRAMLLLWCYLLWYVAIVAMHFDPSPRLWINALGMSLVVGTALYLGVRGSSHARPGRWQIFRLYLTPFCVSSYVASTTAHDFVLIFPPDPRTSLIASLPAAVFLAIAIALRRRARAGGAGAVS